MKGLGVGKNATFDVDMTVRRRPLNLNCGGGLNPNQQQAQALYGLLAALFWPPRYKPAVAHLGLARLRRAVRARATRPRARSSTGPTSTSAVRADDDLPGGQAPRRRAAAPRTTTTTPARDPYKRAQQLLRHPRGAQPGARRRRRASGASFGEMFTVYGGCQVNVGAIPPENWPLMAAIIRATAKDDHERSRCCWTTCSSPRSSQKILGADADDRRRLVQNVTQLVNFINDPERR